MLTLVQDQLDVAYLKQAGSIKDPELFDTIVALIARTYVGQSRPVRIDGVEIPLSTIQSSFRQLSGGDVLAVIDSVSSLKSPLRSPIAYLTSCLYNAAMTASMVSQIEYNRDMEERYRPDEDENFDYSGPLRPLPLDQIPNFTSEE